jgi:peptidyl-prolyl cis-trans isomerase D
VSDPVKTQFGTMLISVPTVEPEKVKPLAEVADELRREVAVERARSTIRNLRDKIEDERSSGKALADAAKVVNATPLTVEVESTGTDNQGKAAELPEREALLRAVFGSDVGVDNDHVTTRDGGFIWFEVLNVEQSRERRLDEVRDQVVATWKDEEINKRMAAKVSEILTAIRGGQSMADAAKANNAELKREASVSRLEPSKLPESAVARVFGQPVGEVGSATTPDLGRVIFKSLSNNIPAMEAQSDVMKQISDQLRSAMSEDLLTQYLTALRARLGVTIYEAAVRSATGATDQNN